MQSTCKLYFDFHLLKRIKCTMTVEFEGGYWMSHFSKYATKRQKVPVLFTV